jgi:2-polyprenyl-6-methoxyphenol hydroxylase-like FAD-dependent oxidoreductase
MTPNLGQGGNNSIESVASLMNQLNVVVKAHPKPTTAQLQGAFSRYQKERQAQVNFVAGLTGSYTRWTSWKNWLGWFIQAWLWPMVGDRFIINWNLSPMIKDSIKLDFVDEENLPVGTVKWKYA